MRSKLQIELETLLEGMLAPGSSLRKKVRKEVKKEFKKELEKLERENPAPTFTVSDFRQALRSYYNSVIQKGYRLGHPTPTKEEHHPAVLLSFHLWNDIIADNAEDGWLSIFDIHTRKELILDGQLGTMDGITLYTDGFEEPHNQVTRKGEFYILPQSTVAGLIEMGSRRYFLTALNSIEHKVMGNIPQL